MSIRITNQNHLVEVLNTESLNVAYVRDYGNSRVDVTFGWLDGIPECDAPANVRDFRVRPYNSSKTYKTEAGAMRAARRWAN